MTIRLKDGSAIEIAEGSSAYDLAATISEGLARNAAAAEVNDEAVDLRYPLSDGDEVTILTFNDDEGKHAFWHTSSHILAQAVKRLYPEAQLAIGPAISNGFYYDIDREGGFGPEDLEKITAEMKKIVKEGLEIERFELPRQDAIELMEEADEPYKVELIRDLPEDSVISFYRQGEFVDLCAGPHLMKTSPVKAIALTSIAGAYWRGDEKNKMLTRIYGVSFTKKADLNDYLEKLEEARQRDHRKVGKEMKLFMFNEAGPGFPFWLPNGMKLKNSLLSYWHEIHDREDYQEISSPMILKRSLWETSGHWDHYKANMYTTVIDEEDYAVKPMNCPGSILAYQYEPHSYRDLPMRMAELGLVHRHEKSGELHGLMRARNFTQDDAHIYCTPEQIEDEILAIVRLIDEVYSKFGFDYVIELSTRPENSMGSDEDWEMAEGALKAALERVDRAYVLNEGDGAFYGPKIDFHLRDSLDRTWQCGTIQLDFQLPQRFDLHYIGADGQEHRPIMIHRVVLGSVERFIAVLIEEYAGKFPFWLAPEQVRVLPISEKTADYADEVYRLLRQAGLRATVNQNADKLGYKIREAQLEKVPVMLVVGPKEAEDRTVSVRLRDGDDSDGGARQLEGLIAELTKRSVERID